MFYEKAVWKETYVYSPDALVDSYGEIYNFNTHSV